MPKVFYTEKDIEDLVKQGSLSLEVNDNVVLTDLAYEKANRLGLKLMGDKPENPPGAPVRPYIAAQNSPRKQEMQPVTRMSPEDSDLKKRIHEAVVAKMGNQVDPELLDAIIQRVLASVAVK